MSASSSSSSSSSSAVVTNELRSRIQLSIELKNLPRMDLLSKSDPFVVLSMKQPSTNHYYEIGRTEVIENNENPIFHRTFELDYYFEELQELKFDIYDADDNSTILSHHDYIGYIQKPLSSLIAINHRPHTILNKQSTPIIVHSKPCEIIIHIEEIKSSSLRLQLKIRGEKLDKKDWFGKSDPYLQLYRQREAGISNRPATASSRFLTSTGSGAIEWAKVFQTEVIKKTLDPQWKPFTVNIAELSACDFQKSILVKVWDWDSDTSSDHIGDCIFTLEQLTGAKSAAEALQVATLATNNNNNNGVAGGPTTVAVTGGQRSYTLRYLDKKGKDGEKSHGTIHFDDVQWVIEPTFLDYIKGGMQISLMVGIDFTGSNGHPDDQGSLHFRRGRTPNPYQTAIECIGNILAPYDSDQQFPIFGFGANIRGAGVQHCFPLTFNPSNVEVHGVQGMLGAYSHAINNVDLSGPTYFAPLLDACSTIASSAPFDNHRQSYYILLLLTDGVVNDLEQTIRALVRAAKLPLSVIIVGVGGADFSAMKVLDGDEIPLVSAGEKVARDIVQFVAMRDFAGKPIALLAKETLAEIPQQVIEFAKMRRIAPMQPKPIASAAAAPVPNSPPPNYGDGANNNAYAGSAPYAPEYGAPSASASAMGPATAHAAAPVYGAPPPVHVYPYNGGIPDASPPAYGK